MADDMEQLEKAARQLIAIEELFGGAFIPAKRNPLPELAPRKAAAPAPADEAADKGILFQPAREAARGAAPARAAQAQAEGPSPYAGLSSHDKAAALEAIFRDEAAHCRACALHKGRNHVVFGEGNVDAELVFVGEGPGEDEDHTGRPFVGRAGQLLTRMISAMGLDRGDVYICNMVKCRPPGNRTPLPDEVQACWGFLVRQLQILQPKVIVTLGNPATQGLLNTRTGITKLRGQWQRLPNLAPGLAGIPVMPTFHPSYVLRSYTKDIRQMVWDDLQMVMERLGLKLPEPPKS